MGQTLTGLFTKNEVKQRIADMRQNNAVLPDYDLAVLIAVNGLMGQTDKANAAYSHHLMNVSRHNTDSETKMIIGILHDLVEDSDWELDDLRDVGFAERIIKGVEGVTHKPGEKYFDSIVRCGLNPDSVDVKLKDNRHNQDGSRNNWLPTVKDLDRQKKYIVTRQYLVSIKKGDIAPGTSVMDWMKTQPPEMQDFALVKRYSSANQTTTTASTPKP